MKAYDEPGTAAARTIAPVVATAFGIAPLPTSTSSIVTSTAVLFVAPNRVRSADVVHVPLVMRANGAPNVPPSGARNASRTASAPVPRLWWSPIR